MYDSEAASGIFKKTNKKIKRTAGAFLGGTLEVSYASTSSIHHRVSRVAVKIGVFYMNGVPTQLNPDANLDRMYSIYSGMLNILNTKSRLGWNEVTVSITK